MALNILIAVAIALAMFKFNLIQPYQIMLVFFSFVGLLLILYKFIITKGLIIYSNID